MKKGFTLIELLAVIVILAIIALIATPIVLNIINNTRDESNKRSIDLYGAAVTQAVARYQLNNNISIVGSFESSLEKKGKELNQGDITLNIDYDGNVQCDKNKVNKDGSIYLSNCKVNGVYVDGYAYGKAPIICKAVDKKTTGNLPQNDTNGKRIYTAGDEYECEVKDGTIYTFFILSTNNVSNEIITNSSKDKNVTSVNLILHKNIASDGSLATEVIGKEEATNGIYNKVEWISGDDYESYGSEIYCKKTSCTYKGPITAMNYLYNASKDWHCLDNILITSGSVLKQIQENIVIIESQGSEIIRYENLKTRLPSKQELSLVGCDDSCPDWIKENLLEKENFMTSTASINNSNNGIWYASDRLWNANTTNLLGVRPVITVAVENIG